MELNNSKKSTLITSIFLLCLIVLASTYVSAGRSDDVAAAEAEIVYEIDYRGPETHSSINPPPGQYHRLSSSNKAYSKLKCSGGCHGEHAKRVRG